MGSTGADTVLANIPKAVERTKSRLVWVVAVLMVLVSDIPNIIWHFFQPEPDWLFWVKALIVFLFLGECFLIRYLRPLWKYAAILLAFFVIGGITDGLGTSPAWLGWFGGKEAGFAALWSGRQILQLGFSLVMAAVCWLLLRRRQAFFLAKGQTDAELEPVRWLGVRKGEKWTSFGWIFAGIFTGGTVLFVVLAYGKFLPNFGKILPLLPLAVVFAAVNSFTEEFTYRAPLLGSSHEELGKQPALWINAIFFGFAHYLYGAPGGIPGLLMTTLVGYLLGKSMIETKGSFWALLIHMLADIPIFVLYALASAA